MTIFDIIASFLRPIISFSLGAVFPLTESE